MYSNGFSCKILSREKFLKKVRDFCSKNKILLVFDEIVTGFRINKGGLKLF